MLSQRVRLPRAGQGGPPGPGPGRRNLAARRWPALVALAAGLVTTAGVAALFRNDARRTAADRFEFLHNEISHDLRERLVFYENVLRGAAGLFDTMSDVTREEWRAYAHGLQLDQAYPGIQGLGYAVQMVAAAPDTDLSRIRAMAYPELSVLRKGARPDAAVVVNFESLTSRGVPRFGFDMLSDPIYREAMIRARDSGKTAMTGKVQLLDGQGAHGQAGSFIFVPAYRHDLPHDTTERRRAAIAGYFYAPFQASELMAGLARDASAGIATELYDGDDRQPGNLMYASSPDRPGGQFQATATEDVFGRPWSMRFRSLPAFDTAIDGSKGRLALVAGLLSTGLLFGLLLELATTRRRGLALAESMTAVILAREAQIRESAAAMTVARDVAVEASRAKTDFLATMSHEIRTPLNGVIGFAELLLDTPLSDEQRQHVQTLKLCGEKLLGLVNDVLDLSKIEAGRMDIAEVPFELRPTLRRALAISKARARQKSLTMTGVVDDDVPEHMVGDPHRLEQVLLNLVSNAVKFTETGSVEVRVEREESGRAPVIRFDVTDTGPGISLAAQTRLFEPFIQVDGSSTRKHDGTGLGLAICKRLVKAMGGNIGVDSAPGRGSRFWFTVRFQEARAISEASPAVPSPPASAGSAPPGNLPAVVDPATTNARESSVEPHILLAEDNKVNQTVALAMLRKYRISVDVAVDGQQALEASGRAVYDLIFMDCQMPGLDGFEATARIREAEVGGPVHVPIVALTANALADDRERCLACGMDDYLSKPLTRAALDAMLRRWVPQIRAAGAPDVPELGSAPQPG